MFLVVSISGLLTLHNWILNMFTLNMVYMAVIILFILVETTLTKQGRNNPGKCHLFLKSVLRQINEDMKLCAYCGIINENCTQIVLKFRFAISFRKAVQDKLTLNYTTFYKQHFYKQHQAEIKRKLSNTPRLNFCYLKIICYVALNIKNF